MDDGALGFADELARQGQKIYDAAEPAMTRLSAIAGTLKMPAARSHIEASIEGLRRPTFTMIVFGRFNTGKSTFLNVLLGRLERELDELPRRIGAPLPMDDMPCNARVTTIRYGEEPSVTVVRDGGKREVRSLRWFLDNSPLKATKQENQAAFGDIEQFELTYPFENGRAGIVLIDTPGTDDAPDRTIIALQALNQADAAIMLFNTVGLAGEGEVRFAREMMDLGLTNYFTVINRYNGRTVDDRLKHYAWDRLVGELHDGPAYEGQDFADQKIHFVDALAALEGRLAGDAERVQASGVEAFEAALAQFYETERRKVHVQRWTDQAIVQAAKIESFVAQQVPLLRLEHAEFQRRFEEVQPLVQELETRKSHPDKIFTRFRQRAVERLLVSFQELVFQVAEELPAVLEAKPLTSLKEAHSLVWSSLSRKKQEQVAQEAGRMVSDYFTARLKVWETAPPDQPGVRQCMAALLGELMQELQEEIDRTERDFEQLRFSLADNMDSTPLVKLEDAGEWWTRIAPAAAGLLFGPDLAVSAAVSGWKGFGKGFVVHVGALIALAALGAPMTAPVVVAGWIASFLFRGVWSGLDLQRQAKQSAVRGFAEGMRDQIEAARPKLAEALHTMMRDFEGAVSEGYAEEIDQQIVGLRKIECESALSRDDKNLLLEQYARVREEAVRHKQTLAYVRSLAAI